MNWLEEGITQKATWVITNISVFFFLKGDFKNRAEMIDFNIRIKNVTRSDAGKYRCEVSAPSEQGQNLEEDTVTLEVLGDVHVYAWLHLSLLLPHPALGATKHWSMNMPASTGSLNQWSYRDHKHHLPGKLLAISPHPLIGCWNFSNALSQSISLLKMEAIPSSPTMYIGVSFLRVYFSVVFSI